MAKDRFEKCSVPKPSIWKVIYFKFHRKDTLLGKIDL